VSSTVDWDPFAGGELARAVPTTAQQQEIWLALQYGGEPANLAFNEVVTLEADALLDAGLVSRALRILLQRHESLRATFSVDGSQMLVSAAPALPFSEASFISQHELQMAIQQDVAVPFDLVSGPLFRTRLLHHEGASHLVLAAHHIVCDGWSFGVLLTELGTIYSHLARPGETDAAAAAALEPAPEFGTYALALTRALASPDHVATERFWQNTLGNSPAMLDLPADRPRPSERRFEAAREDYLLPRAVYDEIKVECRKLGVTASSFLMAAFNVYLYRLTNQTDFVIGMPAAGQADADLPGLVGHCVNTLPLRVVFTADTTFADLAKAVRKAILDASNNARVSFGALVQKLGLPRDPSRIPLVPVTFNLDKLIGPINFGPTKAAMASVPRVAETFELFLNASERPEGVLLETQFNTNLFDVGTVRRWLAGYVTLLKSALASPTTTVARLEVLTAAEKQTLIVDWNATQAPLPDARCTLALIEETCRTRPQTAAIIDNLGQLTYEELNEHANFLALKLVDGGLAPGELVGIALRRDRHMLICLLAVWKAGAAYVPLDPDYPEERLAFIASDSHLRFLLVDTSSLDLLPAFAGTRLIVTAHVGRAAVGPHCSLSPQALAYVLHTSGSTGKPKGVMISHEALCNLLLAMVGPTALRPGDVLLAVTTLSFDIAGVDMFLPAVVGATTAIATREQAIDGAALGAFAQSVGATFLQATPATWRMLLELNDAASVLAPLRAVSGGEALPRDLCQKLFPLCRELWNAYGPTETTIWSTLARIRDPEAVITIGRPLANTTLYIVDSFGQLVPIGAYGELWIGGLGVAQGYLNRPELTADRFIADPFSSSAGAQLYKTGDIVRYGAEGELYFARRNDNQVKVRGFRIELGDIEAALGRAPGIRAAAAVVRDFGDSDVRIVAYVVAVESSPPTVNELREHLRTVLPPYMLPQYIVILPKLPLTPNGKVDKKALPAPLADEVEHGNQFSPPQTPTQVQLAGLWQDLLRANQIGLGDNFFDLGGHSMLATRLAARVRTQFGVDLSLRVIFSAQTLESMSARIDAARVLRIPPKGSLLEETEF